ncbi:MAG: SgcJ/EcaC family oxidoreductase [Gemmatimonadota bacterium]
MHVAVVRRAAPDAAAARTGIAAMLDHGARAWNRGDLNDFVSDYLTDATFVTSRGVVRGVAAIRERYAPRFGPGGVRDSLFFRDLEVDLLGPDVANAIAFYVLMRGDSVTASGPTSLVVRRVDGRWRIVHDHSS